MGEWDGTERRQVSDQSIRELLITLNAKFDAHLVQEAEIRPKLEELVTILERSKGVVLFLKLCIYVGAPIYAIVYWIKDHVRL